MKLSVEAANAEFERFAESMDLDLDIQDMDEDEVAQFEKHKRIFCKALTTGHCEMNDAAEPTVVLKKAVGSTKSLTFKEPTGASFLALDRGKKDQAISKMYHMMSVLCDCDPSVFSKMAQRDLKVCQSIALIFLD